MKSIFDGWTKQILGRWEDGEGGYCVSGWINRRSGVNVMQATRRIGQWVIDNMEVPDHYVHPICGPVHIDTKNSISAMVWANNERKLDIEGFKMVDLLTQGFVPEPAAEAVEEEKVSV
jgi:hypothetical protein